MEFIFTSPTFVADNVVDKLKKEKREYAIHEPFDSPINGHLQSQFWRENSLYGSKFELHLKNKLTQKAIAKECADWIRRKAVFKSNRSNAPMQDFLYKGIDAICHACK